MILLRILMAIVMMVVAGVVPALAGTLEVTVYDLSNGLTIPGASVVAYHKGSDGWFDAGWGMQADPYGVAVFNLVGGDYGVLGMSPRHLSVLYPDIYNWSQAVSETITIPEQGVVKIKLGLKPRKVFLAVSVFYGQKVPSSGGALVLKFEMSNSTRETIVADVQGNLSAWMAEPGGLDFISLQQVGRMVTVLLPGGKRTGFFPVWVPGTIPDGQYQVYIGVYKAGVGITGQPLAGEWIEIQKGG